MPSWICRTLPILIACVTIGYLLTGCVTPVGRASMGAVKGVVAGYCAQDLTTRALTRELAAAEIYPNRIEIQCAADQAGGQ